MGDRGRPLVVVPAYGDRLLTQAVVTDTLRERELVDLLIVDNQGDYTPVGDEEVVRPGCNLGWLRACNEGIRVASARGCESVILLNNDTRLSPGFFAGMRAASDALPSMLIAPRYDDRACPTQFEDVAGGPAAFAPRAEERLVSVVDGTCVLVPTAVVADVGLLDQRRFGRHGWGGIDDYCLRTRRLGHRVAVTSRAFLAHARASTASVSTTRYEHFAMAEMELGMTLKYGGRWRDQFDDDAFRPPEPHAVPLSVARYVQDRLGLQRVQWRRLLPSKVVA
jgi:GT2 family glycosyltransferase